MLGRRLDVPAEVELIDLPEGDDVDPGDVAAAHLLGGWGGGGDTEITAQKRRRPPFKKKEMLTADKGSGKSHTVR